MISVWWFAGCVLVLSLALIRVTIVFDRQRKQIPARGEPTSWRVETKAAAKWALWDDYFARQKVDINQCVQVRVIGPGAQVLIADVDLGAEDFEAQINAATAKAEDRVIALNALLELTP